MGASPYVHDLETALEPVASLHTFHRNPRQGNVDAIRESVAVNGQYKPVIANRGTHTGRPREVLAGNHTLLAFREAGWPDIVVCWVDVDDDQAARIVTADNRTADLGEYDDTVLAELLRDLPDLDGTGYDITDLDIILRTLGEPETLDEVAERLGDADDKELWPALRLVLPPVLHAAWRSHLDTHSGDEVAAFAALLDVDLTDVPAAS